MQNSQNTHILVPPRQLPGITIEGVVAAEPKPPAIPLAAKYGVGKQVPVRIENLAPEGQNKTVVLFEPQVIPSNTDKVRMAMQKQRGGLEKKSSVKINVRRRRSASTFRVLRKSSVFAERRHLSLPRNQLEINQGSDIALRRHLERLKRQLLGLERLLTHREISKQSVVSATASKSSRKSSVSVRQQKHSRKTSAASRHR